MRGTWLIAALLLAPAQEAGLAGQIDDAVLKANLKGARLGIVVRSAKTGRVLYRRGGDEALLPASNAKLFTTAAALAALGPDFKFRTTIGLEKDDLHVFGGGDPNISGRFHDDDPTAVFKAWAGKLKAAGVRSLGAVVLHPARFDRAYLHPDWIEAKYDQDQWWCAPVGALSLNDNCVDLVYSGGEKAGDPVRLEVKPDTRYVTLTNRATTVASSPKPFGFVRRDGTNEILANGQLAVAAKPRTAWVAIQDPTAFFGAVLKETLEAAGIACGDVREADTLLDAHPGLRVVDVLESDLLKSIGVCNSNSQNFYAEMITKTLGAEKGGKGTTEAGLEATQTWLRSIGIKGMVLGDGCGLSRRSRVTADGVAALLTWWAAHEKFDAWRGTLAVSGGSAGTLRRRMGSIQGRVQAKTGHIRGVSALSGYVDTAGGERLVFAILVNDWTSGSADGLQDRICEVLAAWKGE